MAKNLSDEEMDRLDACETAEDWGLACDAIKEARGGMYPDDWWDRVKLSGMMDEIMGRWGANSELTLTKLPASRDAIKSIGELVPAAMSAMKLKYIADLGAAGFNAAQIEWLTEGLHDD